MRSLGSKHGRRGPVAPLTMAVAAALAVVAACAAKEEGASGSASGPSSGGGGSGGLAVDVCSAEGIVCDGTRSVTCSAEREPIAEQDCATEGKVCAPDLGCVACVPWSPISCDGGKAVLCDGDGSGPIEFSCDP